MSTDIHVQITGNGLSERTFDTCELNHKYYLPEFPDWYFIVRKSVNPTEGERVCLYRENVINFYRFGNMDPGTMGMCNELRLNRPLSILHRDMRQKAEENRK